VPDHLKCYKVRDRQKKATYTANLGGLVTQTGCTIRVPAVMACVPSTKTSVAPPPPGDGGSGTPNSFFCYKVKCAKATLPTLTGADQFGSRTVTPKTARLLCAPLAGPPTTTTTTASTTTTTTIMTACPLPATGQTTCWNSSGTVITCTGTGHDGDLRKGAALAYMDNGDGTITDVNTGLQWEKQSSDGSVHDMLNIYTWDQAFSGHVATLNTMSFAGHIDWRVPNVRELQSIANYQNFSPAVSPAFNTSCTAGCTVLTCSCSATPMSSYWSSSSYAASPDLAWYVAFGNGSMNALNKGLNNAVRGVRGGS
jgi:hypothetical protein